MARALWLPDVLSDAGLTVHTVKGWEARGSSSFKPRGMVWHHTAGAARGNFPTLPVLVDGRRDLPGPLCQIGGARNGDVYVIASGRANHAGSGGWRGLSGNTDVFGWEPEHVGTSAEPWGAQLESMRIGTAAIFRHLGWDHRMLCGHKEWTSRKVDPYGVEMVVERARLEVALRPPKQEVDMLVRITGDHKVNVDTVWVCNGAELVKLGSSAAAAARFGSQWRTAVQEVPADDEDHALYPLSRLPRRDP